MILYSELSAFMDELVERIPALKMSVPITIESNMADKIGKIGEGETPVLFFLPPSGTGSGSVDAYCEDSACVVFVMQKYNPRTATSAQVLADTHPLVETVKAELLRKSRCPCCFTKLDYSSISTLPETEFFGCWAGWSIAFTIKE